MNTQSVLSRVRDALVRQQEEFVIFSFKTVAGQALLAHANDDQAEVAEMLRKLGPLVPYLEQAVDQALEAGKWEALVGNYHGNQGICPIIKRVPVGVSKYNTDLHKPSHAAFNKWAQIYFNCPRMRLYDDEHPDGHFTLKLLWSPATLPHF